MPAGVDLTVTVNHHGQGDPSSVAALDRYVMPT